MPVAQGFTGMAPRSGVPQAPKAPAFQMRGGAPGQYQPTSRPPVIQAQRPPMPQGPSITAQYRAQAAQPYQGPYPKAPAPQPYTGPYPTAQAPAYGFNGQQMSAPPAGVSAQAKTFAGGAAPPADQGVRYEPNPYTPNQLQPGQSPTLGGYTAGHPESHFGVGELPTAHEYKKQAATQETAQRQRDLLGPYADIFGITDDRPLLRADIPMIQQRLAFENRDLSEADLQHGVDALRGGRSDIGQDPTSVLAQQLAMDRAQNSGSFSDAYMDQQRGLIRNRGAIAGQSGLRALDEANARRGVQGPLAAQMAAESAQQSALGTQGQLADFEQNAQAAREEAQRAALSQLQDISSSNQSQRSNYDQMLANAYLQNQRETPDIEALLTSVKGGSKAAGGLADKAKKKHKVG